MSEPRILAINREQWLQQAVDDLTPFFLGKGLKVPAVRVSCGWPSRNPTGTAKRTVGECWDGKCASDGTPQLFISPLLQEECLPNGVLGVLSHELLHAIDFEAKHGPKFRKMMEKIGLEGKPTATTAGQDLCDLFKRTVDRLGPYPHVALMIQRERKKQTTRQRKCSCETCGYVARVSQKWIDLGPPICPVVGHGPMRSEIPTTENE